MEGLSIGTLLHFGAYQWRVLDIKDDAALIITKEYDRARIYHDAYGNNMGRLRIAKVSERRVL